MNKKQFMAMSIFSNLKYLDGDNKTVELHCINNGVGLVNFGWGDAKEFPDVKPIVRPLSDLAKKCLEGGLIPIFELARLSVPVYLKNEVSDGQFSKKGSIDEPDYILCVDGYDFKISTYYDYPPAFQISDNLKITNQFELFQKLIEWHFDIFGLIEKGEAVDYHALPDFVF